MYVPLFYSLIGTNGTTELQKSPSYLRQLNPSHLLQTAQNLLVLQSLFAISRELWYNRMLDLKKLATIYILPKLKKNTFHPFRSYWAVCVRENCISRLTWLLNSIYIEKLKKKCDFSWFHCICCAHMFVQDAIRVAVFRSRCYSYFFCRSSGCQLFVLCVYVSRLRYYSYLFCFILRKQIYSPAIVRDPESHFESHVSWRRIREEGDRCIKLVSSFRTIVKCYTKDDELIFLEIQENNLQIPSKIQK